MKAYTDKALLTLCNIFKQCLEHKATESFRAELSDDKILELVTETDIVSRYIKQGLALLGKYNIPSYVAIVLEYNMLSYINENKCSSEEIKALVMCRHLLLNGLYLENLDYFISILARECSNELRCELFEMFSEYYNSVKNCYQTEIVKKIEG